MGDNVLRVDLAASPADKKNAHDQKLAVFVGNMSYSVEENALHNRFSKVRGHADDYMNHESDLITA